MDRATEIREGMTVYGAGDQQLGTVEQIHGNGFHVNGQHIERDQVLRVTQNGVYLRGGAATTGANVADRTLGAQEEDTLRVPEAEERLAVGKREVELGQVEVRKTVTEEQQTVPVTLTRDEVLVREERVAERPATGEDLFEEGTIRVPIRGEEAVVAKEAVVTGEVVIEKDRVAEEQQITDTVRRQRVDVEKAYQEARTGFEQAHTTRATTSGRTFEQAEPNYRAGFTAAHDERYAGREFEDVEPELRSQYDASTTTQTGSPFAAGDTTAGSTGATMANAGDNWEHLREEIREGWTRARGR
jgi:uncharacterized protein (TIGR02271 family)